MLINESDIRNMNRVHMNRSHQVFLAHVRHNIIIALLSDSNYYLVYEYY